MAGSILAFRHAFQRRRQRFQQFPRLSGRGQEDVRQLMISIGVSSPPLTPASTTVSPAARKSSAARNIATSVRSSPIASSERPGSG
ncbi:MAG: hypothetical protein R3C29_00640 [Dehalococcoidia bacterium]